MSLFKGSFLLLRNCVTATYRFTVSLEQDDTKDLYGKYVHQPMLIDRKGRIFRRAEEFINFKPQIKLKQERKRIMITKHQSDIENNHVRDIATYTPPIEYLVETLSFYKKV